MKKQLLFLMAALFVCMTASAAKTVYIPSSWVYNSSTQEYTENGNSDLQWSYNRSKQSDNCIIFWQKGFGTDPSTGSITFDVDAVLQVAEQCYAKNVNELGFSCGNMLNKYKLMILMSYTNDWVCYGGGYDFEVSALWIGPSAVNPAGHSLAHEVGHSFHYMCYAEAANYNHNSSSSINTGFHLPCGNGQAIWEQTAQWQANQTYPDQMFPQSYPLFGNNANYAFSHEWMRYQSYWFHYYLCQYYNDLTTVAQIWKQPMTGQTSGNATDFCQAYIANKGLTAAQFYERYFDYAMRCTTFDFDAAASYRDNYIGNFDYHCAKLGDKQYQVAYRSVPQSTGFNVIELDVPSSGTTVTTAFKALTHGCALDAKDPATYNNGNANSNVSAGVDNYNSAGTASYRGFRVGYVFLKSDGTRSYYNDGTVHCTGTAETTENISTTVPANTSRMFLVVTPALSTYVRHPWDDDISNDDQWPYSFTLTGTDLKSKSQTVVYTEEIPDEPEFTKVIDGRNIADVTLTYNVVIPPDASGYTGTGVTINTGNAVNALCTAFQLESSDIFGHVIDYTASQGNNTIMSCALASDGSIQAKAKNTNGTFGHWFNSSGTVQDWGNGCVVFTEYDGQYATCNIGQYPGGSSNGTTRTVREGLIYKDSNGNTAKATFVFNVTFKTGASAVAYLSDIDYDEPTSAETDNWPDITTLPEDYSKYFFIFKDHTLNLYLTMRDGVHQGYRTMFYSHQDADKPEVNKNSLWTVDAYQQGGSNYQIITNAEYRDLMLQTEYDAAWNYRTHDNGGGDMGWGRVVFDYDNSKSAWTILNGVYPDNNYLGPWDNQFVDGAEVACNKNDLTTGYFDISQILRGEYVATYEDLTTVDYDNPLDITYCLENEGGERRSTLGWKNTGAGWWTQTNNALNGTVGSRYLESWNGNGLEQTDFYQEIYGLPEGYYRFSAVTNCSADCYLYANSEQTAMSTDNPGTRINVVVQVTGSEGYLKVGAKTGDNPGQWIAFDEAKLEYLGTTLPSSFVGTPTSSIADGSYQQRLTGWTLNFTEATSNVPGAVFDIVNTDNMASLYKNNTKVRDFELSVSGTEVTVNFISLMLSPDTEYRLELPAGTVGYAGQVSNEAVSVTFRTPVVWDGTYYLYNTYTNNYISRGGEWATAAVMDDWGLALHLSTNTEGKTTLKYFDSQRYLYNDGFCYGDGTSGLNFTMSKVDGGFKFLNQNNNRYLAVWGGRAVGDAAEGDNLDGTSNIWTLESTTDHVDNYTRNADTQAATAAQAAALTDITTQAALDAKVASDFYAITVDEQEKKTEKYQVYAAQAQEYTPAEYEKFTVENLTPGLYRLTLDAFQRAAWFNWVNDADGARGCIYLYANDAKTQLKSVMEYSSTTAFSQNWSPDGVNNYINGIPEAYDVLEEGHYNNVVYVYVPEGESTITYGITNPNRLGNDMYEGTWCCYHTFKLEYLKPYTILDETATTAPVAEDNAVVKFKRTIVDKNNGGTNNAWNTICFPFALSAQQVEDIFGEGTVVKALSGVTKSGEIHFLTFSDVTDGIAANKPYIMQIQPGNEKSEYIIENIDITPSENLTVSVGGVDFVGNYINQKVMDNIRGTDYYILNDVFKSSTGRTKIKGFRAYFHVPEGSGIKALGFNLDGDATSIETIEGLNVNFPADIYNVGGQLVRKNADNIDNLPAGIYFVNGKKVIKR